MTAFIETVATPTSSGLERDARSINHDGAVDPGQIALGVIIGRAAEFFDFFVYAIASVLVFPHLLFPWAEPLTATLYSFCIFPLAFLARPLGSVVFMTIDRKHGRGVKLTIAMFLLGGSTVTMAFLPGYAEAGVAAIIMLGVLRFCQGLALGGAWDGLASLLALNAPQGRRGWYAMMPQLGAPIGFVLAAALFCYFVTSLSSADFYDWGWRFPFFVAFAINVVALFARLRLVATSEFGSLLERHELEAARVTETVGKHGVTILMGAFVPLASYALFHLVTVFPLSWASLVTKQDAGHFLLIQIIGGCIGFISIMVSGIMADRVGRRTHLGNAAALIAVFSFVTPQLYGAGNWGEDAYVLIGFGLLGLSLGQAAGALASNFSRAYRYTGAALTSDLAWLLGAGFAPLVALGLSSKFGLSMIGLYLLSGAFCTLIALYFNKQLETRDE